MNLGWPQQRLSDRQLIAIPLVLVMFLGAVALVAFASGSFPMGRDLKGGSLIRVEGENVPDASTAENLFRSDVDVEVIKNGLDIKTDNALGDAEKLLLKGMFSNRFGIPDNAIMIETMGPTITSSYAKQARNALIGAFAAICLIILVVFRHRVGAGVILLAIGLDMMGIFGCMKLFGVELSLASIAGLLMIIGYAVDTNILLTTRVLKGVGEPSEQVVNAMRTGLMMGGTTLIPIFSINLLTTAPQLYKLTSVLIFGIVIDVFNTWFLNSGILMRHVKRKRRKEYYVSV